MLLGSISGCSGYLDERALGIVLEVRRGESKE